MRSGPHGHPAKPISDGGSPATQFHIPTAEDGHSACTNVGEQVTKYTGDLGDDVLTGLGGGIAVCYHINDMWAVGADFGMARSKHHDDGEDAAIVYPGSGLTGTISDKITLTTFGVHGKYMFPMPESPLHPYVVAGFGMGKFKEKFETDNYSEEIETDNELSYRGGLGATWMFNDQFGLNGEANYRSIQTEGEASNSIGFDLGFTWSIPMAAK